MLVGIISAPVIPSDEQHVRYGLTEGIASLDWEVTALGCPQGDNLFTVAEVVARERSFGWVPLQSMATPGAVDNLFTTVDALLVVTDGDSYAMAQYEERARHRLGATRVLARVVPWEQGTLW